MTYIYWQQS